MEINRKVLFELPPYEGVSRNSEGDFIRLPDGKLMFAFTRYYSTSWDDHENSTICAIYSEDGINFNTSEIVTLIKPERVGGSNAMSVSLKKNRDGGISLYCIVKFDTHDVEHKPVRDEYYRFDSPDGYDFSAEPILCFPKNREGYYAINNSRVYEISTGRIFIPASEHKMTFSDGKYRFNDQGMARFYYSDDGGNSFKEDVQVLYFPEKENKDGLQEPGLIELPDGTLYGFFRTNADYQYESFSYDGGITWTDPVPSKFESPLSPLTMGRNPYSGKYYAVWNPYRDDPQSVEHPRFRNTWGRTPLAIAESEDGIHFCEFKLLESDIHRGYCYSAIYFLSENEALVSYCSGGGDIVPLQRTTVSLLTIKKNTYKK